MWNSDCGLERLDEVVDELRVLRRVEVVDPQRALDLLDAVLRDADRLELLVVLVVGADLLGMSLRVAGSRAESVELRGDAREVVVDLRGGLGLAGDDERRPRLVDEDRVDLVDDRKDVAALDARVERDGHVVAEIVEAELRVRPVRDVRLVRRLLLVERLHRLDRGDRHPERLEDGPVPLGVALREVVVRRDEVRAEASESVEIEREARDERLAFARLHLGDVALVEDDPAHQLDVEHPLVGRALARLANGRERVEDELVEALAVLEPLAERGRQTLQLCVGELLVLRLERRDVRGLLLETLDAPALADAQDLLHSSELLRHGSRVAA